MNIAIVDQPKAASLSDLVRRFKALTIQINALETDIDDTPEGRALWSEKCDIDTQLASIPAKTLQDLQAKAEWLRIPENFNSGDFEGANEDVLLSLFDDIQTFESEQGRDTESQPEFINMTITDLAIAHRLWARLYDQVALEFSTYEINSRIGGHIDDCANYMGMKADAIAEELISRCPGSEEDRKVRAWALLHRSHHINVFDDTTRAAIADLELAESRSEVTAQ